MYRKNAIRHKHMRMLSNTLLPLLIGVCLLGGCASNKAMVGLDVEKVTVEAPFAMPTLEIPDFSDCPRISIADFGAVGGDHNFQQPVLGDPSLFVQGCGDPRRQGLGSRSQQRRRGSGDEPEHADRKLCL